MKKRILVAVALLVYINVRAGDYINFTVSKPLCLLTFLEAANGTGNMAPALTDYIKEHVAAKDSARFYSMVRKFSSIGMEYSIVYPYYLERRPYTNTVFNLITIAAAHTTTVDEFLYRIIGILPNEQWMKLKEVMEATAPYYDSMMLPYKTEIATQLTALQTFSSSTGKVFNKLKAFYGSTWGDIPFTICVYPVPGAKGATSATPHSNSVVLAVLTGEKDYAMRAAIAIHEIGHVLYQEQPLALQQQIDATFLASNSPYKRYAYSYIDEALATACGNGWAYKALSGHIDEGSWYSNKYINGYAHAIYPIVAGYIEKGKVIDKEFIDNAIDLFGRAFPTAIYDYQVLLNRVNLYTDADNNEQYAQVNATLRKYFTISSCAGTYPMSDPQAIDMMGQASNTQLFIVHTNTRKNFEVLKAQFPQLKNIQEDREGITSFIDTAQRPVVIINLHNLSRLDAAVKKLADTGNMNPAILFTPLD